MRDAGFPFLKHNAACFQNYKTIYIFLKSHGVIGLFIELHLTNTPFYKFYNVREELEK